MDLLSLWRCSKDDFYKLAFYLTTLQNQLLETEFDQLCLVLFNGRSAAHFAFRSFQMELLSQFLNLKRSMKVKEVGEHWNRNDDYILAKLTLNLGWNDNTRIIMSPLWQLIH